MTQPSHRYLCIFAVGAVFLSAVIIHKGSFAQSRTFSAQHTQLTLFVQSFDGTWGRITTEKTLAVGQGSNIRFELNFSAPPPGAQERQLRIDLLVKKQRGKTQRIPLTFESLGEPVFRSPVLETNKLGIGTFSIDISFPHVKTTLKDALTFTINSTRDCVKIIDHGKEKKKINVAFIGDSVRDMRTFENRVREHATELFAHEPFASNKRFFNIFVIKKKALDLHCHPSGNGFLLCDSGASESYCPASFIVGIIAQPQLGGAAGPRSFTTSDPKITTHEFAHTFGLLADEYMKEGLTRGSIDNTSVDPKGKPKVGRNCGRINTTSACRDWCSGAPITVDNLLRVDCQQTPSHPTCLRPLENDTRMMNMTKECTKQLSGQTCMQVKGCTWVAPPSPQQQEECQLLKNCANPPSQPHPFFRASCIPSNAASFNVGTRCQRGTGCFLGCSSTLNLGRATENSIMLNESTPTGTFEPINERLLCERIKEVAGSAKGICSRQYGIK